MKWEEITINPRTAIISIIIFSLAFFIYYVNYEPKDSPPSKTSTLNYKIIEKQDISYRGNNRVIFRVVMQVSELPTESNIKNIARNILKNNKYWDELTIFFYLPEMDSSLAAYAIADFIQDDMKEFSISKSSLLGTKWHKK